MERCDYTVVFENLSVTDLAVMALLLEKERKSHKIKSKQQK